MFQILGQFANKILNDIHQNINQTPQRCLAIFSKSTEKEHDLKSPYIILRANKDDYKPIIELMHEGFYPDEPVCASLGLNKSPVMDECTMRHLVEGISLVAKCKYDGCIAGASVNVSSHPWDPELKEKLACNVQCSKVKHMLLFLAYTQRMPDLWNCYQVAKIFEITNIFTLKEHRKRGLSERLLQKSRCLAADCGFQLVRCDAPDVLTAELCEKMNMQLVATIPYCSYVGKNMKPVFCPPHPQDSWKVYVDNYPQIASIIKTNEIKDTDLVNK